MTGEITCPHCGTRNPLGANFCYRCGASLSVQERAANDPAAPLPDDGAEIDAEIDAVIDAALKGQSATEQSTGAPLPWEAHLDPEAETSEEHDPTIESLLAYFPIEEEAAERPIPVDALAFPADEAGAGAQGYLESVSISGDLAPQASVRARGIGGDVDHWRAVRALVREEPVLATASGQTGPAPISYRKGWVFLLILVAALMPFFLGGAGSFGAPAQWTGVEEAFDTINGLTLNSEVIVFWQVDPATAGELDLVALPVVSNLLERGARSIVITLQPTGLATARRLYANAVAGLDNSAMITVMQGWAGNGAYLTGGLSALPLIGQDLDSVAGVELGDSERRRLVVAIAPTADDIQQWLEVVQPVNKLPVVAVTGAAGGPVLQPYLQSGQLAGLVSGFDGAASYQSMRADTLSDADARRLTLAVDAQNWGALALLIVLVAGSVVAITRREPNA